jgi:hypothetical protein
LQVILQSDSEEKALQTFLLLNHLLTKVHKYDYATALTMRDFCEGLEGGNMPFARLVALSKLLSNHISKAIAVYQTVIETFPKRYNLQERYSGFLHMIGKVRKAEKYRHQAMKLTQRRRKRVVSGIDRLIYDDQTVTLIVVPLTGPHKGQIAWCVNSTPLGYPEETLNGQDCSILLPKVLQAKHAEMLAKLSTQRSIPQVTLSTTDMHICILNKEKQLLNGAWRAFCANDQATGELICVVSIRLEPTEKEFAIISPIGELEERTPGFAVFMKETAFQAEGNLSSKDVVWKGQWGGGPVFVSRDVWQISARLQLSCVSLFKMRNRRVASLQKGLLMIDAAKNFIGTKTLFQSRLSQVSILDPKIQNKGEIFSQNQIKSQLKWLLRLIFLALILLFLSGSTVTFVIESAFADSVLQVSQSIAYITSIGMRTQSIRAAIRSKELYLINAGFGLYGNETAARLDLNSVSASFRTMRTSLYGNSTSAMGRYRRLLLEPVTPLWRYENDQFNLYHVSLLDLMDEMVRRTRDLANCSLGNITRNNGDFMTLYRNGAAEALYAFNASVGYYGESKNEQREKVLAKVELAAILGPFLCLCVFFPLLIGILFLVNRKRRLVWTALLKIPKDTFANSRKLISTRFKELSAKPITSSDCSCRYGNSTTMKVLLCSALLFCCVVSISGLGFYIYGASSINKVLQYKPAYIDWQGQRRAAVAKIWFHMRETWLPRNLSYSAIYEDTQPFYNPWQHWELASDLILMLHHCLTLGCPMHDMNHLFPSDAHKDLLIGRGLGPSPASLAAGLTPLLNELTQLSSAARADLKSNPQTDYSKGKKLEKYISLSYSVISQANQLFDADTAAQVQAASDTLYQLSIAFVCFAFVALVLVELPLSYVVSDR